MPLGKAVVMGILNVTPDSFSDGGAYTGVDAALKRAEVLINEGAAILDIGGESTRPKSGRITEQEEIQRVIPIVEAIASRFDIPISVDTTRGTVAHRSLEAGAEIVNDISALRFDEDLAGVVGRAGAGLVLMHSLGDFETMHRQPPVDDILAEETAYFSRAVEIAVEHGIGREQIVLDVGIGFSKSLEQNLELLAKIDKISLSFLEFPLLAGTSRKSFIGRVSGEESPVERLGGSVASAAIAVWNGAKIVRAHEVKETVQALAVVEAIRDQI